MTKSILLALRRWFDSSAPSFRGEDETAQRIDWPRVIPFFALHAGCLGVMWVGWSTTALAAAILLYVLRMFAVTGFYHRYFSHRAFRTTRAAQFMFAVLGATAVQRGPLWWASHHRHHHLQSDRPEDSHSPGQHGFLWSHLGWFLARANFAPRMHLVSDLAVYRELRWLDRFDAFVPAALAMGLFGLGEWLDHVAPSLQTDGLQLLVWGFCVSTAVLYHSTFAINSLAHRVGRRCYATKDDSRNSLLLALLTFGEGWHNNHHHFPGAARQGFHWYEIDLTYYGLRALQALRIIWDLRPVPEALRAARLRDAEKAAA